MTQIHKPIARVILSESLLEILPLNKSPTPPPSKMAAAFINAPIIMVFHHPMYNFHHIIQQLQPKCCINFKKRHSRLREPAMALYFYGEMILN